MNGNLKISIITTVFNIETYIEQCINSIINQTYKNFELIIVNDATEDNSMEVIYKFDDDRIKIINNSINLGCGISRQVGINNANGDYILFVDGDDYLELNCLETLVNNLKNNVDMIVFGIYHKGKIEYPYNCWLSNKLIKSDIFKHVRYSELRFMEDIPTLYRILCYCNNIIDIKNVLITYRVRPDSLCNSSNKIKHLVYRCLGCIENLEWSKTNKINNIFKCKYNIDYLKSLFLEILKDDSNEYMHEINNIKKYIENYG